VYRATDTNLKRAVAIKVLPESVAADAERMARFQREAEILASLNHPNIAAIYGLERSGGTTAIVMELVEGPTLADRIAQGAIPIDEALPIAKQIADALEAAHERGIIHRDLKPANIKVREDSTVKVLDFGLAKALEGPAAAVNLSHSPTQSVAVTRAGVILGTVAYMSPEQARGKPLDKRADIWAFGCVLYETLTRRATFAGQTVSDTIAHILEREPDWQALPKTTPAGVRVLLRRCLQKDASRRLQHIGDARVELEEALGPPVASEAAAGVSPTPTGSRPWRWIVGAGLAGLVAASLVLGGAMWQRRSAAPARAPMRFSAVTNFAGVEAQPSLSPDGRSVVFVSNRGGQFGLWVGLVTGGNLIPVTPNDRNVKARPRWSPDGTRIAYARLNEHGLWDVWVVPALGGAARRILANASDPAWSPDGRWLAYANRSTNRTWMCDSNGANARPLTPSTPDLPHREPAFSRDGQRLAFVRRTGGPYSELAVADVATGTVRHLTKDNALLLSPVWSPGDAFIYFSSSRGGTMNIWKVSAEGGGPEQITAGQGDDAELDLSADGKRLVFSSYRMNINLTEVALDAPAQPGRIKWLTRDSAHLEAFPAYSPDGKRIAYFSARNGAENESIWVMDADGSNAVQLVGDARVNVLPRWMGDSETLVYQSLGAGPDVSPPGAQNEFRSVTLSRAAPQILPVRGSMENLFDVARDGRLVYVSPDASVQVFNLPTGPTRKLEAVKRGGAIGGYFRWSPSGKSFAYLVTPLQENDSEAGVWVYNLEGTPRQVFRGWVVDFNWMADDEMLVLQGTPDLAGRLVRVRTDGTPGARIPASIQIRLTYIEDLLTARFDIHPDRRRIVTEAFELHEADIGMIENVR
jgi:Tol biopolymer transport system component